MSVATRSLPKKLHPISRAMPFPVAAFLSRFWLAPRAKISAKIPAPSIRIARLIASFLHRVLEL
jgi:hypothetical protein